MQIKETWCSPMSRFAILAALPSNYNRSMAEPLFLGFRLFDRYMEPRRLMLLSRADAA